MKFVDIYLNVLKNFSDFKTRSNRAEFWIFVIVNILASIIVDAISSYLGYLFSLAVLVVSLAVGARRLHDIGKSGWMQLWMLLPVLGWIYLIYLWAQEGESLPNKWGMPPSSIDL